MSRAGTRKCGHCGKQWTRTSRAESLRFCPDCDSTHSWCSRCAEVKPTTAFNRNTSSRNGIEGICRVCSTSHKLKSRYGIDREAYELLLIEQDGLCGICEKPPGEGQPLHVDHCHEGGQVRGLLCSRCNTAIGLLKEDLDIILSAANYVKRTQLV